MNATNEDDGTRIETFENRRITISDDPDSGGFYKLVGDGGQLAGHTVDNVDGIRINGVRFRTDGRAEFDAQTHYGTDMIRVEVYEESDGHRQANLVVDEQEEDDA